MNVIALRCRWPNGSVTDTELLAVRNPARWTSHDAREVSWAIQRALRANAVFAIRLKETSPTNWRVEIVADTGIAATSRALPLSAAALVWFEEVVFELAERSVH